MTSLYVNKEESQFTKYHHAAHTSRHIMQECAKKTIPETPCEPREKGDAREEGRGGDDDDWVGVVEGGVELARRDSDEQRGKKAATWSPV